MEASRVIKEDLKPKVNAQQKCFFLHQRERSVLTPSFWGTDSRLTDGFDFYFCCCSIRKSGRLKTFCLKGTSSNGGVRQ